MNELISINSELHIKHCVGLTQIEQEYVNMYAAKRVQQTEENELKLFLRNLVKLSYQNTKIQLSSDINEISRDFDATVQSWYNSLLATSKTTSIEEIKKSIELGSIGKLSQHYGRLGVETYMNWLVEYQAKTERINSIKKYNSNLAKEERERTPPSKEQLEVIFNESMQVMRIEFERTGEVSEQSIKANFEAMWRRGLLKNARSKMDEYLMEANNIVIDRAELIKKTSVNKSEYDDAVKLLIEIESSEDYHAQVKIEARRLALKEYLKTTNPQ